MLICPNGSHYQCHGKAVLGQAAIVFIHGVGLDLSIWQSQVEAFKTSHQVITYDLIGHGQSPHARPSTSFDDLSAQLLQLIEHLGLEKIHLVGFSLGGLIARVFATQHPARLQSLTIMNSVFNRSETLRNGILERVKEVAQLGPSANVDQALRRWFSPQYRQQNVSYIAALRQSVIANHTPSYIVCYRLFAQGDNVAKQHLGKITCPTLVTTGELDPGSTPAMSHALAAQLNQAQVVILADARHMMPVENASQVNHLLVQFINACDA